MSQHGLQQRSFQAGGYQDGQQRNNPNQFKKVPQRNGIMNQEDEIPNIEPQGIQNKQAYYTSPAQNPYQGSRQNQYQEPQKKGLNLQEPLVELLASLANLVSAYAPSDSKEQIRDLVNQSVQDYPELEPKLLVLLQNNQKKPNQPSRAEIPSGGCQHRGAERYMTVCKQSHCKECLRELIFASADITQNIACPCGISISRKNRDEIAPELNPNLQKKPGNSTNIPPANLARDEFQAGLNPKPNPQNFQPKKIENANIYNQYAGMQDQPQPFQDQNPPLRKQAPLPNPPNKQIPPQKYQPPPDLPKNLPRQGPRIDPDKLFCCICNTTKDIDEFTAITCSGHDICSACRVIYSKSSDQCPTCQRHYSDSEIDTIAVLAVTLPAEQINPPLPENRNMRNIQRREEIAYQCVGCGNQIPMTEVCVYECQHPIHNQCVTPQGCPACRR